MASVIVPVLAALEPTIAPLIIKLIDHLFPKGSGATKLPVAVNVFQNIIDGLVKAGAAGQAPDAATITAWVNQLVATLNSQGILKGPDTVIAPPFAGTVNGPGVIVAPADTVDKTDARRILSVLESIAPALGAK